MMTKFWWIGLSLVFTLGALSGDVAAQERQNEQPIREFPRKDLQPGETETTILQEKVKGLEIAFGLVEEMVKAGIASPSEMSEVGCDLSLAKAELAALGGNPKHQIKHLQEALNFAENQLERELHAAKVPLNAPPGAGPILPTSVLLAKAVVRRADIKLALFRAKKNQNSR